MQLSTAVFWIAFFIIGGAQAAEQCGELAGGSGQYGPFDYRTDKDKLPVVELHHFTSQVENLVSGQNSTLGGDIDYTLRAFPNHHRALMSMTRLADRLKTEKPPLAIYTVACYFDRAVRFRPTDGTVRMLYAIYLAKRNKPGDALQQLKAAEEFVGENANLQYNMGLVYLDLKDYDKALAYAHRAYQAGFPLPGLRNRLQRAGKWRDASSGASVKPETVTPAPQAADKSPDAVAAEK